MSILKNKGFTLLEMIVYMSIFSMICLGSIYISMYVQKIYQKTIKHYSHQTAVYTYLNLIQKYATKDINIHKDGGIIEFVFNNEHISKLKLYIHPDSKELCLGSLYIGKTQFKETCIYPETKFASIDIVPGITGPETLSAHSLYIVHIDWDGGFVEEYIYVPKNTVL